MYLLLPVCMPSLHVISSSFFTCHCVQTVTGERHVSAPIIAALTVFAVFLHRSFPYQSFPHWRFPCRVFPHHLFLHRGFLYLGEGKSSIHRNKFSTNNLLFLSCRNRSKANAEATPASRTNASSEMHPFGDPPRILRLPT